MTIRSGRFKSEKTIIKGRTNTYFRILNSGEFNSQTPSLNAITVKFGTGAVNSVEVLPTFSLDFCAQDDVEVKLTASGGTIEGMYEALPNPDFNSGRFKTKPNMDATVGVPIITPGSGNSKAIYRIFNTGPIPIQMWEVNAGGTAQFQAVINESESLDFVTPMNKTIWIKGTMTKDDHIEGIYYFIAMA